MKIVFIGDIVGRPGRRILRESFNRLSEEHHPDLVIANCENAASGFGVMPEMAEEFFELGIDVLTGGNHTFDRKDILPVFHDGAHKGRLLRPANYPEGVLGSGLYEDHTRTGLPYAVLNLMGRTFMPPIDCPFKTADRLLESLKNDTKVIIVDMHAETTSEKQAMGRYLDGRVSAVLGTHTHVPTADERVLPEGTAFITDVGMTGPYDSIIGNKVDDVLERFLTGLRPRLEVANGDVRLCGAVLEVDEKTGKAKTISRLLLGEEKN
jgi:metallophosphoesterase (TIGR00282 family)